MGRLLMVFYLFVGVLCSVSIFVSFSLGEYILSSWLFLAAIINFFLFNLMWKEEKKREVQKNKAIGI